MFGGPRPKARALSPLLWGEQDGKAQARHGCTGSRTPLLFPTSHGRCHLSRKTVDASSREDNGFRVTCMCLPTPLRGRSEALYGDACRAHPAEIGCASSPGGSVPRDTCRVDPEGDWACELMGGGGATTGHVQGCRVHPAEIGCVRSPWASVPRDTCRANPSLFHGLGSEVPGGGALCHRGDVPWDPRGTGSATGQHAVPSAVQTAQAFSQGGEQRSTGRPQNGVSRVC